MDILIPLDGKPHSQRSVDLACRLFDLSGRIIVLVHVIEAADPAMLLEDTTGVMEETYAVASRSAAEKLLDTVAQPLRSAGANVILEVLAGQPAAEIKSAVLRKQVAVILAAPGRHAARDILFKGSLSAHLLEFDFTGTIVLARSLPEDKAGEKVVFVLDGSEEASHALKALVPFLAPSVPLLAVASDIGYPPPAREQVLSRAGGKNEQSTGSQMTASQALQSASEWLTGRQRAHETRMLETTFQEWLDSESGTGDIALLALARRRADVLHRPLGGSAAEHIFLTAPCSTSLYCSKIKP
jgi:nucleotide-binding universal stress UspA family protein